MGLRRRVALFLEKLGGDVEMRSVPFFTPLPLPQSTIRLCLHVQVRTPLVKVEPLKRLRALFLIKGLTSLRELSLQDNKISTISIHAFAGLKKLRILDLSRNHLHYLLQETFEDISGLTTLYLSGNRFSYEEKPFIRLPALQEKNIKQLDVSTRDATTPYHKYTMTLQEHDVTTLRDSYKTID
uniref:Uncharacterized protein n=1 Tax=Timema douglasi TaxID=61478 RepID=A0A7R8VUV0_TIMDO|nr:unnamed protein product [Timema douglasi]